jgi:hypothetical protein
VLSELYPRPAGAVASAGNRRRGGDHARWRAAAAGGPDAGAPAPTLRGDSRGSAQSHARELRWSACELRRSCKRTQQSHACELRWSCVRTQVVMRANSGGRACELRWSCVRTQVAVRANSGGHACELRWSCVRALVVMHTCEVVPASSTRDRHRLRRSCMQTQRSCLRTQRSGARSERSRQHVSGLASMFQIFADP